MTNEEKSRRARCIKLAEEFARLHAQACEFAEDWSNEDSNQVAKYMLAEAGIVAERLFAEMKTADELAMCLLGVALMDDRDLYPDYSILRPR